MDEPDVQIGEHFYKLIAWDDPNQSGLMFRHPPAERDWGSLFASQQSPSGKPSVENLKSDDLRVFFDDFSGGEGQIVMRAGDPAGETRYRRSVGVDLSNPSGVQLAKEMAQVGLTGSSSNTVQGDTWVDVTGSSTVSGNDRRVNAVGDIVKRVLGAIAAGNWQADFYAKVNAAPVHTGDEFTGGGTVIGTKRRLHIGASVDLPFTAPADAQVTLTYDLQGFIPGVIQFSSTFHLVVRNAADTDTLADSGPISLNSPDEFTQQQTFKATNGTSYILRVRVDNGSYWLDLINVAIDVRDTKTAHVSIYNETAGTTVASGDVDMAGVTSFQRVATLGFTTDGSSTYSMRYKRSAGESRSQWVDKGVYTPVSLRTPWNVELGQGQKIWLFDRATGSMPNAFTWDVQNRRWLPIGGVPGTGGSNPQNLAHSDYYEYVLLGNGQVWRARAPSTVEQYTAGFTNAVGIAVGANRLYVLTDDTTGTNLYEIAVDDTPTIAVPGAATYPVGGAGSKAKTVADQTIVRRIVGTPDGCVFFVTHGPVATLYHYASGSAGAPVTDFPPGFVPRVIAYSLGLVYIGGGFPSADTDGVTRNRPAIFVVDLAGQTAPIELDVKLHRDGEDPGSLVQDMQLYGSDLWVMTQVTPAGNKRMRLWRVNLTASGGTFLSQEILTDESMQAADARALAVTWRNKIMVWGSSQGAPYVEQDTYGASGTAYLETSIFNFALTEQKILLSIAVNGDFPDGTSADLWYSTDDGATWAFAGSRTQPGFVQVSDIGSSARFRRLAVRVYPKTTNNAVTPSISEFSARAYLIEYDKSWTMLLNCMDATSGYGTEQVPGSVLAANIFSLADSGELVEFTDFYSSKRTEDAQTYRGVLKDPQQQFVGRGESTLQVTFVER